MGALVVGVAEELHGDAAAVGEQHHVAQLGDVPVQLLDAGAGHVEQLVGLVLVVEQHLARHEARRRRLGRVEAVVLDAAFPRAGDQRVEAGAGEGRGGVGVGQDSVDVRTAGQGDSHAASSDHRCSIGLARGRRYPQ
ncbi:hypothetical protein D3C78_1026380 [compost metagenome]